MAGTLMHIYLRFQETLRYWRRAIGGVVAGLPPLTFCLSRIRGLGLL